MSNKQQAFTFNPSECKLRHPMGSEKGTCPCLAPRDCPKSTCCDDCGKLIDGRPYRVRSVTDHNETDEVCFDCYMNRKD